MVMEIGYERQTTWMTFRLAEKKPKTTVWHILNKSSGFLLATVMWYGPFRQYCFFPFEPLAVFNVGCLNDITKFLSELNDEQKRAHQ